MNITLLIITCLSLCSFGTLPLAHAESFTDSSGQSISFSKPFSRVISLYPAHTENLYSLGLDSEIIGVSKGDDYPSRVKGKKKFHYREDPEKFMAAQPDLVLVRPMIFQGYPELITKLKMIGIVVVSLQPTTIDEMFLYWQQLGALTGKKAQAQKMISDFKAQLARITETRDTIPMAERRHVYFEAIHSKMKTFSTASMAIFALESAGGINVAQDAKQLRKTNIAAYGKEKILSHASEISVFLDQQGRMNRVSLEEIYNEPGFQVIEAIKNQQVFSIDEKIVSRPTMRMLDGIQEIQKILYPNIQTIY